MPIPPSGDSRMESLPFFVPKVTLRYGFAPPVCLVFWAFVVYRRKSGKVKNSNLMITCLEHITYLFQLLSGFKSIFSFFIE